jgi:4,5-dihydroxyphthalate decarboxylase
MSTPKPHLTFACGLYDRMQPLFTGEVKPEGIDLEFIRIEAPRVIFDNMAAKQAYDLSEMSSSEYIARRASGDESFVALPVFPSRSFRHSFITINKTSGIQKPKDLAGKRIGVPLYTMTAAIWIRGHLEHDHDVDLSQVTWVQGSINSASTHGEPTVMPMHKPVPIELAPNHKSLSDLLDAGEIDAIIGTTLPHCIKTNPQVERLFPNFRDIEKEYFRRTHIFPIMHLVAIKKSTFEAHPNIVRALYQAFEESKNIALLRMKNLAALRYMLPWLADDLDEIDDLFNGDPWPYGLEKNLPTLNTLIQFMIEQGVIAKKMDLQELFLPV